MEFEWTCDDGHAKVPHKDTPKPGAEGPVSVVREAVCPKCTDEYPWGDDA